MKFLFKEIPHGLDIIYRILIYLSISVFLIILIYIIDAKLNNNIELVLKLLVPLGVLLSAGLASVSVLKSIRNTQELDIKKYEKDKVDTINKLDSLLSYVSIIILQTEIKIDSKYISHLEDKVKKIELLISDILKDNDLSRLNDKKISNIIISLNLQAFTLSVYIFKVKELESLKQGSESINKINMTLKKIYKNYEENAECIKGEIEQLCNKYNLTNTRISLDSFNHIKNRNN